MTGATGQLYGIRLLELLAAQDIETHLVLSDSAQITIRQETDYDTADITGLADVVHSNENIGASPASGSFETAGMVVAPCSMKTLSNVAHGDAGNLIVRAADVALKERRPLVLLPRETPLNRIHLENMLSVTDAGGIVMPPLPSFYNEPESIDEMVTDTASRALSYFDGIDVSAEEWAGLGPSSA
ncbi:3-polyprenyl-4-hydroxybenzoate carboxy-lyase UbiX [Halarchaeum acidiphilum MH1-52-1]|uniref:Flavin prenyltransferase UbiX n=1 Tax=Halarchaeum acidiphilum MH1-52-1 TaxID=1261545 RepID=U2YVT6_9EURY|nr:3-polyprenyl-4-hydroxybenzoate carboxy-lyase UbiX [Halarchaeum acidiphilum MH1-52-1]